jgi:UDP-N-acetylglucosamine 2-epimerase (non-hydrolysing)
MRKIMTVFGTRPEAIKMAPLVRAIAQDPDLDGYVCLSGQHAEMLSQVMDFFDLKAHHNLEVMQGHPDLTQVYSRVLERIQPILQKEKPDLVVVHGDTATTAAASMAAFFQQIPVAHVEAGLRTGNLYSPWPEEFNRRVAGLITKLHFAPTEKSKNNLLAEGIASDCIEVTGNTVIDALFLTLDQLEKDEAFKKDFYKRFPFANTDKRLILVTGHRRENFGEGLDSICNGLSQLAERSDVEIVYPVHLNPNVKGPVNERLGDKNNIHLIPPLEYNDFIYLMKHSYLIITDSGGVQEEAPSLGKPVLVTRNTTERPEAVESGTVKLVGTDLNKLLTSTQQLLDDQEAYLATSRSHNPYGDGNATQRIMERIRREFSI